MWQERVAEIVYPGWDPFRLLVLLSARRIRTEGRICGGCTTYPAPCLVSTQRVCLVCVPSPLAGSIFVYWTTFCQLPIAHQLLVLSATQIVQTQLVARTDRGRKKKRVQAPKTRRQASAITKDTIAN